MSIRGPGGRAPRHSARSSGVSSFDYYVDPAAGNDGNAGTLAAPVATLSRALTLLGSATGKRIAIKRGTTLRNDPATVTPNNTYIGAYGFGPAPRLFGSSQIAVSSFTKVGNLYSLASHTYDPGTLALVDANGNATKLYASANSNTNSAVDPAVEGEFTYFPATHATPNLLKFFTSATITGFQVEVPQGGGTARTGVTLNGSGCTIQNLVIRYWNNAGFLLQGDNTSSIGIDASFNAADGGDSGINTKNFVVSGCSFTYNGKRNNAGGGPGDGFSAHSGSAQFATGTITFCTFIGNTQTGVGNQSGCQVTTSFCYFRDNFYDFNVYNISDSLIGAHNCHYNVFVKTGVATGSFFNSNGASGAANEATAVRIRNNTFYASGWTATAAGTLQGFAWTVDSNVAKLPSTVSNFAQIVASTLVTSTNNSVNGQSTAVWRTSPFIAPGTETGLLTNDPLLTNPASGDFTLQAASPCINTGSNWGQTQDYNGKAMVGTPDRGAFER